MSRPQMGAGYHTYNWLRNLTVLCVPDAFCVQRGNFIFLFEGTPEFALGDFAVANVSKLWRLFFNTKTHTLKTRTHMKGLFNIIISSI